MSKLIELYLNIQITETNNNKRKFCDICKSNKTENDCASTVRHILVVPALLTFFSLVICKIKSNEIL